MAAMRVGREPGLARSVGVPVGLASGSWPRAQAAGGAPGGRDCDRVRGASELEQSMLQVLLFLIFTFSILASALPHVEATSFFLFF
jgi:hypothetical protein